MEPIGVWATHNDSATDRRERGDLVVAGRLAPGVTSPAKARAEMETIAAGLARAYPGVNDQCGVNLQSLREAFSVDARPAMLTLLGAVDLRVFWWPART